MTLSEIIKAVQASPALADAHLDQDGIAGPATWLAIYRKLIPADDIPVNHPAHVPSPDISPVDARSEANIATLLPQVQPYARALLHAAAEQGIIVKVTSALRTYAEQDALYEQGRSKPGPIVTNARGGDSWHNHGVAFDVTLFIDGKPVYESPAYKAIGAIGKSLGLEWGGSWLGFVDEPHFQMTNGKTLAQAKALHDAGSNVFA